MRALYHIWLILVGLGGYCLICWVRYLLVGKWAFSIFLAIYAVGFLMVGISSRPQGAGRGCQPPVAEEQAEFQKGGRGRAVLAGATAELGHRAT